ncbi:MAG: NADH-quinone oxidoreductase subunit NuoE [Pseudomonadota bacterium]|nr:NADH-quinone oxidoreductase subunit NuoE [Pseudomonadota bacterium]
MPYELSDSVKEKIEREAVKYPSRQAAVKSALRYAQQEFGWVSEDVIKAVAAILELQPIQVFEVATFYDMFYTTPVGRHQIRVCTNVSCMLRGADGVLGYLKNKLGVDIGGTTEDGRISLFEAECLGACGGAPMLVCGDRYFENLSNDRVDEMLAKLD